MELLTPSPPEASWLSSVLLHPLSAHFDEIQSILQGKARVDPCNLSDHPITHFFSLFSSSSSRKFKAFLHENKGFKGHSPPKKTHELVCHRSNMVKDLTCKTYIARLVRRYWSPMKQGSRVGLYRQHESTGPVGLNLWYPIEDMASYGL